MTQNTYPITFFVDRRGQYFPASETDQAHSSLEAHKRVRTVTRADIGTVLVVSAGIWDASQLPYQPFRTAVALAAVEAEKLGTRGFKFHDCQPWATREECAQLQKEGRITNPIMRRALWLCAVKGYSTTGALRTLGHPHPEKNGRVQLARNIKRAKKHLEVLRELRAHSGT